MVINQKEVTGKCEEEEDILVASSLVVKGMKKTYKNTLELID